MATATSARILDAAFERVATVGLGSLALEDVARDAGVSRQTLYRHFGSREGLIEQLVLREEQWFIDRVVSAGEAQADARDAVAAGITAALYAARDHPLLQGLLEREPGEILPLMVLGRGPVISAARPVVERLLSERLDASPERIQVLADICSRLLVSYVLDMDSRSPEAVGRQVADVLLAGERSLAAGQR